MEALNNTITLEYNTSGSVKSKPNYDFDYVVNFSVALRMTAWFVTFIGLPLTLLAICALYCLVQDGQAAPIYIINLLVSNLIQFCFMVVRLEGPGRIKDIMLYIYFSGLMASVGFMVCVALERYLVIACPLWYRFRRNVKVSLVVSFMVWAFSIGQLILVHFIYTLFPFILLSISLLLPFPLLIFFLVGTLKALSISISVPPEEKRRIVAVLVLVLLNYTLLFLPMIISFLAMGSLTQPIHPNLSFIFVQFSPLVDLVLYVFMRKGGVDKLLCCLCLCRMTRDEEQGQNPNPNPDTANDDTTGRVSSV
ncbi:G-protein coupled receptor 4-like [Centroberyx affinis]|uniref:G-protein coupled receptor 4-like n=1 Tax=Centroberyx affinis TaxID=166261 RepID=UPI003A5C39FC